MPRRRPKPWEERGGPVAAPTLSTTTAPSSGSCAPCATRRELAGIGLVILAAALIFNRKG